MTVSAFILAIMPRMVKPGVRHAPLLREAAIKDTLTIRAGRKPEEGCRYLYNGRSYGRFERSITLPEAVDAGAVQATLKDGVLLIELPKSPEAKPRKITLKSI